MARYIKPLFYHIQTETHECAAECIWLWLPMQTIVAWWSSKDAWRFSYSDI